jgi:hypothetical protein
MRSVPPSPARPAAPAHSLSGATAADAPADEAVLLLETPRLSWAMTIVLLAAVTVVRAPRARTHGC